MGLGPDPAVRRRVDAAGWAAGTRADPRGMEIARSRRRRWGEGARPPASLQGPTPMVQASKQFLSGRRLVVVSNRLPVVLNRRSEREWSLERGAGGLVTALEPVLSRVGGVWVGWPGVSSDEAPDIEGVLAGESPRLGYRLEGVPLSARERDDFYLGFSNQVVWPLFHDFQGKCNFLPRFWDAYVTVNRKFAHVASRVVRRGDFLWVQDYHLMGMGESLRERGLDLDTGFFLHTPFPALDIFRKLPWRLSILRSLLHYDLLGLQTPRDRENFLHTLRCLAPSVRLTQQGRLVTAWIGSHAVKVGVFPISIDAEEFERTARAARTMRRVAELRATLGEGGLDDEDGERTVMILGVDRLDYTKGIPHKLRGYRAALRKYPDLRGRVTLLQLVIPSREDIPEYNEMKDEIERLVGEISGEFQHVGWSPIYYRYGTWDREELVAHYRAARIALVTPLKDGMNLVAKEYCVSSGEAGGVLILSEHAGAAAQLQEDAVMVNPYDEDGIARAIQRAFMMKPKERGERMARLRARIRAEDIHWWARTFLQAAGSREPAESDRDRRSPLPEGFMSGA